METKEKILELTKNGPYIHWVERINDLIQTGAADILPTTGLFSMANVNWHQSPVKVAEDIYLVVCHNGTVTKFDKFLDAMLEAKKQTFGLPHPPGAGPEYGGFADFEKGSAAESQGKTSFQMGGT